MQLNFIEDLMPQNSFNEQSPQKEIKTDLRRVFNGGYWIEIDEEIEPSHLSLDIWSYCDNPKDLE
ncbi:hypothetical protein [Geminocystis sp. NIES-3709]|uniref:hypothetical protein n=1 Tax=Geminocystis sp. NIES-3709 TaxID=1617448 RepID=UPI0005FC522E|nr:hypothetical protein [Geminocystis sp. NIES-3709]BAQ64595.1 hypothetical protein GM3709_1360 [Geminocystis sp. NIES-3709]